MKKTIFFDLDDTLYADVETNARIESELRCIELFCRKHPSVKIGDALRIFDSVRDALQKEYRDYPFSHNREMWFIGFLQREHAMAPELAKQMADLYWKTLLSKIEPYYDMKMVLPVLAKKHRLAVISNGVRKYQVLKLKKIGLARYFESLITSSDAGFEKPHQEIFHFALKEMGAKASGSYMVGDSPFHDIKGGNLAGMKTVWLRRGKRYFYPCVGAEKPNHVITNGIQLLSIL